MVRVSQLRKGTLLKIIKDPYWKADRGSIVRVVEVGRYKRSTIVTIVKPSIDAQGGQLGSSFALGKRTIRIIRK